MIRFGVRLLLLIFHFEFPTQPGLIFFSIFLGMWNNTVSKSQSYANVHSESVSPSSSHTPFPLFLPFPHPAPAGKPVSLVSGLSLLSFFCTQEQILVYFLVSPLSYTKAADYRFSRTLLFLLTVHSGNFLISVHRYSLHSFLTAGTVSYCILWLHNTLFNYPPLWVFRFFPIFCNYK